MAYRKYIVGLSIAGIIASWTLPLLIRAVHEAHGFSTVIEFEMNHMINVEQVEAYRKEYDPAFSIFNRVRAIGELHLYMPILSALLSGLFCVIGLLAWRSGYSTPKANER